MGIRRAIVNTNCEANSEEDLIQLPVGFSWARQQGSVAAAKATNWDIFGGEWKAGTMLQSGQRLERGKGGSYGGKERCADHEMHEEKGRASWE